MNDNQNNSLEESVPDTVLIDLDHMNTSSSRPVGSVAKTNTGVTNNKFRTTNKAESIDEEYDDDEFD